jgi:tRNA-specific adenosine deaminase 2
LALEQGEVPVGCVFYHKPSKQIIAKGHNLTNDTSNATTHAEMNCFNYVSVCLETDRPSFCQKFSIAESATIEEIFKDCILYVTCEPCIMCAYALSIMSRFK